MRVRVEEIKLIKTALKNLYAVLSDERRKPTRLIFRWSA